MTAAMLLAGALLAPSAPSLPDGNALVRELAQKQRRWEDILNSYTYDVEAVRDELDKEGRVTKRESRRFEVFYVKGRPIRRLVAEEGRPLGAERQAKVDREVKEKVDAVKEQRVAVETTAVRLSQILERYDFRSVDRETVDGRPAIVLEFTALPGSRPLAHDDVLRNLAAMKSVAGKVRFHNIGLSIDLGAEWLSFADIGIFPFVEIKVDRKFVAGCAENALKQMVCRQILDLADTVGARTVAEGVETRADFEYVREMGFGMVQGSLFAKPMPARKFARAVLSRPLAMPH